jgi:hypothetical protein
MRAFIGSAFFLLAIGPAYANAGFAIAWQFGRLPLVPVALLIELPFLVFYFGMSWTRATIADLSMNLASAIVGFAIMFSLQPFWGFPNTFQLQVAWVLGIAAFNSVIEAFVLRAGFSERIDKTRTAALLIANIASSAIIMWGLPSGNFNDKTEGVHPIGGVALAPDGALYGVTTHGDSQIGA